MPMLKRPDGAIYYEEFGDAFSSRRRFPFRETVRA
jgi:hypothetical protein